MRLADLLLLYCLLCDWCCLGCFSTPKSCCFQFLGLTPTFCHFHCLNLTEDLNIHFLASPSLRFSHQPFPEDVKKERRTNASHQRCFNHTQSALRQCLFYLIGSYYSIIKLFCITILPLYHYIKKSANTAPETAQKYTLEAILPLYFETNSSHSWSKALQRKYKETF